MTSEGPGPQRSMYRGELVYLAAWEPSENIDGTRWISDREIAHNLGFKQPISRAGAEQFAKELLSQIGRTLFQFTVRRLDDDARIGAVSLRTIDRENGSAEVSIFIGEHSLLGHGYGTDAMNCLLDFAFGELRLERVGLGVFDYNERAIRSYEKSGFRTDAVLRHARFHRGAHHDVHIMSILRDEWLVQDRRRAWDPPAGDGPAAPP